MTNFRRSLIQGIVLIGVILLFSSFFVPSNPGSAEIVPGNYHWICKLVRDNWSSMFLVLSELAALLPGPWNGILQAILRGLASISRNKSNKL